MAADHYVKVAQVSYPSAPEDLVPEEPTDAVGRYCALLLQEQDLTRRQAKYEEELKRLNATGDQLREEWEDLKTARAEVIAALQESPESREVLLDQAWTFFKVHLFALCQQTKRSYAHGIPMSPEVTQLAEPVTRNPRLTE